MKNVSILLIALSAVLTMSCSNQQKSSISLEVSDTLVTVGECITYTIVSVNSNSGSELIEFGDGTVLAFEGYFLEGSSPIETTTFTVDHCFHTTGIYTSIIVRNNDTVRKTITVVDPEIITLGGCTFEITWFGHNTKDAKTAIKAGLENSVQGLSISNIGNPVKVSIYDLGWSAFDKMFRHDDLWGNPDYQTSQQWENLFTSGDEDFEIDWNTSFEWDTPIRRRTTMPSFMDDYLSFQDIPKKLLPDEIHSKVKKMLQAFKKEATPLGGKVPQCIDRNFEYKGKIFSFTDWGDGSMGLSTKIDDKIFEINYWDDAIEFEERIGYFDDRIQIYLKEKFSGRVLYWDSEGNKSNLYFLESIEQINTQYKNWNEILN